MLIKHDHMFLELHVFIPVLRFFPRTLHEVPTPRLLLFQFVFPSFCSFDIFFLLAGTNTADVERAIIRMHHMMHISDYLIAAHFTDSRGLAEVGHADADPAGMRNVVTLPEVLAVGKLLFQLVAHCHGLVLLLLRFAATVVIVIWFFLRFLFDDYTLDFLKLRLFVFGRSIR